MVEFDKYKVGDLVDVHCCHSCLKFAGITRKWLPDSGVFWSLCDVCGHKGIGCLTRCKVDNWLRLTPLYLTVQGRFTVPAPCVSSPVQAINTKKENLSVGDHIYHVEIDHEAGVAHVRVEEDTISAVYTDSVVVGNDGDGRPGRRVFENAHTTPEAALGAYRAAAMENIRIRMRTVDRETAIIDRKLAVLKSIDTLFEAREKGL